MGCLAIEKSRKWDFAQLESRANGMSRNWARMKIKVRFSSADCLVLVLTIFFFLELSEHFRILLRIKTGLVLYQS